MEETQETSDSRIASGTPEVSVVIPTHRRETRLAFALEALAAQTLDSDRFEVVVVRAADGGELPPAPEGLTIRFLTAPGRGRPSAQRNLGWRVARAPLIAFTDDDCRPAPGWLEGLLACRNGSGVFVQGRTEPDPDERHLLHGHARSMEVTGPSDWYPTCNIAYPRELLERLDGFDEGYSYSWGEDTDLGLRAVARGATRVYADEALVWHAVLPRTIPVVVRELVQRDRVSVLARHPGGRRYLWGGLFFYRSHALLLGAAIAGFALRRRPRLAALALLPYAFFGVERERWRPRRVPRTLAQVAYHLPMNIILDALGIAVTARHAIRHRYPAL